MDSSIKNVLGWKSELTKQLLDVEATSNALSEMTDQIGLKVLISDEEDGRNEIANEQLEEDETIRYHTLKAQKAVHAICSLLRFGSDLEKPVPALVIVQVAARLSHIRPKDYSRVNISQEKKSIYSNSPFFAQLFLDVIDALMQVGQTNMIRWISYINCDILDLLNWTTSSGLARQSIINYVELRCRIYNTIISILITLGGNAHFNRDQLENLINKHIMQDSKMQTTISSSTQVKRSGDEALNQRRLEEKLASKAMSCLEAIVSFHSFEMEPCLLSKVKDFTLHLALETYRDFKSTPSPYDSVQCRYQMLNLLVSILNEPPIQGTISELSTNIFIKALKVERDAEIRRLCHTATHLSTRRPILLSNNDMVVSVKPLESALEKDTATTGDDEIRSLCDTATHISTSPILLSTNDTVVSAEPLESALEQDTATTGDDEIRSLCDTATHLSTRPILLSTNDTVVSAEPLESAPEKDIATTEVVDIVDSDSDSEIETIMRNFVDKAANSPRQVSSTE